MKDKILEYINSQSDWVSKGQIYDLCEIEGYSPETGARICRDLAEKGIIQVSYYKSKRNIDLARYARIGTETPKIIKPTFEEKIINGLRVMVMN